MAIMVSMFSKLAQDEKEDFLQPYVIESPNNWCRSCVLIDVCDRDICSRGVKLDSPKPLKLTYHDWRFWY